MSGTHNCFRCACGENTTKAAEMHIILLQQHWSCAQSKGILFAIHVFQDCKHTHRRQQIHLGKLEPNKSFCGAYCNFCVCEGRFTVLTQALRKATHCTNTQLTCKLTYVRMVSKVLTYLREDEFSRVETREAVVHNHHLPPAISAQSHLVGPQLRTILDTQTQW